jgi:hypothetical protein
MRVEFHLPGSEHLVSASMFDPLPAHPQAPTAGQGSSVGAFFYLRDILAVHA